MQIIGDFCGTYVRYNKSLFVRKSENWELQFNSCLLYTSCVCVCVCVCVDSTVSLSRDLAQAVQTFPRSFVLSLLFEERHEAFYNKNTLTVD